MFFGLLILAGVLLNHQVASADEWTKRLDCGDANLVVDGLHTYQTGFASHHVVIRNTQIISYLASLVKQPLAINVRGELILDLGTQPFAGEFSAPLYRETLNVGVNIAYLNGHWIGGDQYEIYVTSISAGPGWGGSPSYLGKWVLNGCRKLN